MLSGDEPLLLWTLPDGLLPGRPAESAILSLGWLLRTGWSLTPSLRAGWLQGWLLGTDLSGGTSGGGSSGMVPTSWEVRVACAAPLFNLREEKNKGT